MIRCLSYVNSMGDKNNKKYQNFSSYNNVQYYCFQSAGIKESGGSFSVTSEASLIQCVICAESLENNQGIAVFGRSQWDLRR